MLSEINSSLHRTRVPRCLDVFISTYLAPPAVATEHVRGGHAGEERVRGHVLREPGEELGHVDEVHLLQDVLVKTQDSQACPEQALLAVAAEHVPHTARHI